MRCTSASACSKSIEVRFSAPCRPTCRKSLRCSSRLMRLVRAEPEPARQPTQCQHQHQPGDRRQPHMGHPRLGARLFIAVILVAVILSGCGVGLRARSVSSPLVGELIGGVAPPPRWPWTPVRLLWSRSVPRRGQQHRLPCLLLCGTVGQVGLVCTHARPVQRTCRWPGRIQRPPSAAAPDPAVEAASAGGTSGGTCGTGCPDSVALGSPFQL